jgi:hypothetical protein
MKKQKQLKNLKRSWISFEIDSNKEQELKEKIHLTLKYNYFII